MKARGHDSGEVTEKFYLIHMHELETELMERCGFQKPQSSPSVIHIFQLSHTSSTKPHLLLGHSQIVPPTYVSF